MTRSIRTYEQAIEFLFSRINYERIGDGGYPADELKLDRMRHLLSLLGDPQERLNVVHVAGTKGKGSTSVMIAEILTAAGCKAGLFTSPHVSAFEERLVVDGVPPIPEQLVDLVNRLTDAVESMDRLAEGMGPTYFELATALAWLYFRDCGAQIAVFEVGLGGRLDSTNVCRPVVAVITNISRDHTKILGSTVAMIAREKAGIIKPGVPVVSGVADGPAADVVAETCRRERSPLYRLGHEVRWRPADRAYRDANADAANASAARPAGAIIEVETPWCGGRRIAVPLRGEHQCANAALALAAVDALGQAGWTVSDEAIQAGLKAVRFPARIEVLASGPTVIVDAAHNWASAEALARTLDADFSPRRRILIFAATQDKDVAGMLRILLPRFDHVILTQYQVNPRGVQAGELADLVRRISVHPFHVAPDSASAWRLARHIAEPDDLICATGSFFIAAELREIILDGRLVSDSSAQPAG